MEESGIVASSDNLVITVSYVQIHN